MALSTERKAERVRHLVRAAQDLIRVSGDAGFSMAQLAARAEVSPATPYNLIGGKSELLRLVVEDEYEGFAEKLAREPARPPLATLLAATALVVTHYETDRHFYRGLYRMIATTEGSETYDLMALRGERLWGDMVARAVESGELQSFVRVGPLTTSLLTTMASLTTAWFAQSWTARRYALEIAHGVRLVLASVANPVLRAALVDEIADLQAQIEGIRR
jgi:AcrR family transcriptional regulator